MITFNASGMRVTSRTALTRRLAAGVFVAILTAIVASGGADAVRPAKADVTAADAVTDQHGNRFTIDNLKGKPSIVHFGFTHCPVICPTTMNEIATYMNQLGGDADKFNFVFVSVDPERDTAEVLKQYIDNFDGRIIGVTGTQSGIAQLAATLGTTYEKRLTDGGYEMSHVIYGYLLDRNGRRLGTLYLGAQSNPQRVIEKLKGLLGD